MLIPKYLDNYLFIFFCVQFPGQKPMAGSKKNGSAGRRWAIHFCDDGCILFFGGTLLAQESGSALAQSNNRRREEKQHLKAAKSKLAVHR